MKKKILFVVDAIPHCYHGGGGITAYAMAMSLIAVGHQLTILSLDCGHNTAKDALTRHVEHLKSKGIAVIQLNNSALPASSKNIVKKIKSKIAPGLKDLFQGINYQQQVLQHCQSLQPDLMMFYHWDAVVSAYGYHQCPKIALVGDPVHLPTLFRMEFLSRQDVQLNLTDRLRNHYYTHIKVPKLVNMMSKILDDCDSSGAFAAHHAQEFIDRGVRSCRYFRTPTPDPLQNSPQINKTQKFKILHIGHLQGIATLSGVELLAYKMIPILTAALPQDSFEIHVVGGFYHSIPAQLKQALDVPCVKIRGQISPADEEFLSSHVILVPTPIELGIRVRILTALSYGSCVVCHQANQKGIPEIMHQKNCLIGSDAESLAQHCIDLYHHPELRKDIENHARQTYEEFFSFKAAGQLICDQVAQMTA